jgi:hypothetical protein
VCRPQAFLLGRALLPQVRAPLELLRNAASAVTN